MNTYKGYTARIEFDPRDEIFVGRLVGIADIVSFHGASVKELKEAFHDAVDDYLEMSEKLKRPAQKPYSGKLLLRVAPELHAKATVAAEAAGKSLNQWAAEAIERAAG